MNINKENFFKKIIILASLFIIFLPILKYHSLHTTYYDLGLTIQELNHINLTSNLLGHFNIYKYLIGINLELLPSFFVTEALLIFQSLSILLSIYLANKIWGFKISILYLLSFPVWYLALFDFHYDFIAVLLLFPFFYFSRNRQIIISILCAFGIALVKEPYILVAFFSLIYVFILNYKFNKDFCLKDKLIIFFGIFFISIYFYYVIDFNSSKENINITLTDNPSFSWIFDYEKYNIDTFLGVFSYKKILYLIVIFFSISLYSIKFYLPLIVILPIIAISILSNNDLHSNLASHYPAVIIPCLCESLYYYCKKNNINLGYKDFLLPLLIHFFISPSPISVRFITGFSWPYSYKAYIVTDRDNMIKNQLLNIINIYKDKDIVISNTINFTPILLNSSVRTFQQKDMLETDLNTIYVVDFKRPLFIEDQSCNWVLNKCRDLKMYNFFNQVINSNDINIIYKNDNFYIYNRK